jgi:hypothetical protein
MAVTLRHKDLTIEVFDDSTFSQIPDSPTSCDKVYQPDKDKDYKPVSQHAIVVYSNKIKIASAILLAFASAISVASDSVLIDDDNLITRCCNTVFSILFYYPYFYGWCIRTNHISFGV